jgi:hypothetical protein
MGTMLSVPGGFLNGLREGVHRVVFDGVEGEIEALLRSEDPQEEVMRCHMELLGRLNSARTLLDHVGWPGSTRGRGVQADVEVDLERYGPLVLEGLRSHLMSETDRARTTTEGPEGDASERVDALRDLVLDVAGRVSELRSTPDWTAGFADITGYRVTASAPHGGSGAAAGSLGSSGSSRVTPPGSHRDIPPLISR